MTKIYYINKISEGWIHFLRKIQFMWAVWLCFGVHDNTVGKKMDSNIIHKLQQNHAQLRRDGNLRSATCVSHSNRRLLVTARCNVQRAIHRGLGWARHGGTVQSIFYSGRRWHLSVSPCISLFPPSPYFSSFSSWRTLASPVDQTPPM